MKQLMVLVLGIALGAGGLFASQLVYKGSSEQQPYAGENQRVVSSLSPDDIRQLEKGEGWGLAKPAEFNGYPGPAHVLDFADKLDLTKRQRESIESAFEAMNAKARELGVALIEAESALDDAFKSGNASPTLLRERLSATEMVRAKLRETHLAAHLEITPLLNEQQKELYATLRGYSGGHTGHGSH